MWPRRNADPRENSESATYSVVMPIGVAEENYNRMAAAWEPLSERDRPATLLASSGRLIAVTTATRNAATAFRYAAWLVSPANSRLLSTASASVANPRGSFAREADNWLAGGDQALGRGIAEALAKSLREERYMLAPRIPGEDRYLESLGKAIRQTLMNRKSASKALAECALDWDEITAELGPNEQNEAYLRSIGSVDYQPDLNRIAR